MSREVLPVIARECILKRTMATEIDRGDRYGGRYRIGRGIAPYYIHTIELGLNMFQQREYNTVHRNLVGNLFRNVDPGTDANALSDHAGRALNMAALRRLCHAAVIPALEAVSKSLPAKADNVDTLRKLMVHSDGGLRWFLDNIYTEVQPVSGMITAPDKIAEYLALRSRKLAALAALYRIHCIHRSGRSSSSATTETPAQNLPVVALIADPR